MEELSKLRDDLYEALPSGELDAFELIKIIKSHITKLDELIELKKLRVADVIKNEVAVCVNCGISTEVWYTAIDGKICLSCSGL